jgi:hypothetical protein
MFSHVYEVTLCGDYDGVRQAAPASGLGRHLTALTRLPDHG